MAAALPPELKPVKKFVREAKKVQKVSPVVSYYCRLYAVQEVMKLPDSKKTPAVSDWLTNEIGALEQTKQSPGWQEKTREEAAQIIEQMANNIFNHADTVDREGNANKSTAQAFNSAFVFYECLKQFGDRSPELTERAKYCLFKTTDILKALKEGRRPDPGPPGGDDDAALLAELGQMDDGGGDPGFPAPSSPGEPPSTGGSTYMPPGVMPYDQPPQTYPVAQPSLPGGPGAYGHPTGQPSIPSSQSGKNVFSGGPPPSAVGQPRMPPSSMGRGGARPTPTPSGGRGAAAPSSPADVRVLADRVKACSAAERLMKHAHSAMRFNDVEGACAKLEEALALLRPHRQS